MHSGLSPFFYKTHYADFVGRTVNGFKLVSYKKGYGFRVECVECGKQKWASGNAVKEGKVKCNHSASTVYDDSMIGQKFGHLTVIERVGKHFKFRCDCGFEKVIRPTDVCRGTITTCGRSECEFHKERGINVNALKAREEGLAFEQHLADVFERAGYKVVKTPDQGDFGVDVIVWINGENGRFSAKNQKSHQVLGL